jgi:hypothetical protein
VIPLFDGGIESVHIDMDDFPQRARSFASFSERL